MEDSEPLAQLYPRVMGELIPKLQEMQTANRRLMELLHETDAAHDPWHSAIASTTVHTSAVVAHIVELVDGLARSLLSDDQGTSDGDLGTIDRG
jgi:hypothetical protein